MHFVLEVVFGAGRVPVELLTNHSQQEFNFSQRDRGDTLQTIHAEGLGDVAPGTLPVFVGGAFVFLALGVGGFPHLEPAGGVEDVLRDEVPFFDVVGGEQGQRLELGLLGGSGLLGRHLFNGNKQIRLDNLLERIDALLIINSFLHSKSWNCCTLWVCFGIPEVFRKTSLVHRLQTHKVS